jgi:hypothetical protein
MTDLLGLSLPEWQRDKPAISTQWGAREETAGATAARLDQTLGAVAALGGPARDQWWFAHEVMEPRHPLPTSPDGLATVVQGFAVADDSGRPFPANGYGVLIYARGIGDSETWVHAHVGNKLADTSRLTNYVQIRWRAADHDVQDVAGPLIADVPAIVQQLAIDWDAVTSALSSTAIARATRKLVPFSWPRLGAVTWIRDGAHSIPDAVAGATVERVQGGTLLTVNGPDGPSLRVDDVMAVYTALVEGSHIGPLVGH